MPESEHVNSAAAAIFLQIEEESFMVSGPLGVSMQMQPSLAALTAGAQKPVGSLPETGQNPVTPANLMALLTQLQQASGGQLAKPVQQAVPQPAGQQPPAKEMKEKEGDERPNPGRGPGGKGPPGLLKKLKSGKKGKHGGAKKTEDLQKKAAKLREELQKTEKELAARQQGQQPQTQKTQPQPAAQTPANQPTPAALMAMVTQLLQQRAAQPPAAQMPVQNPFSALGSPVANPLGGVSLAAAGGVSPLSGIGGLGATGRLA